MEFWQKQTVQHHHQDGHISNSHVFVRFQHCISLQMLSYFRMAYLWNRRSNLTSEKGKMLKIIIPMIIFLIHMYLWGSDAVFLWRYPHISTRTNFRIGRLKSTSGRSKLLKIIIGLILFPFHKYLWGTGAVFLWRYPHISSRTIFKLGGRNQVLAPFWRALFQILNLLTLRTGWEIKTILNCYSITYFAVILWTPISGPFRPSASLSLSAESKSRKWKWKVKVKILSEYSREGYQKKQHNKLGENPPPHFRGFSGPV